MAITNTTKGLLVLIGVVVLGAGAWFAWQYFYVDQPAPAQLANDQSKPASITSATNQDQLISEVLDVTGLKRQVEQLPEQVRGSVAEAPNREKLSPELAQAIEKIATESFAEENINAHLVAQLKAKFDQKRMQAVVADFSSPLAKRMVKLETTMGTAEDQAAFFNGLAAKPLAPTRISVLQELDRVSNASELGADIAMISMNAMAEGMVGNNPAERALLEREMEKEAKRTKENMRNNMMGSMAYVYRNASDADLALYAKIYETEHAKWLADIVMNTLKQGMKNASKRTGERLASLMKSRGAQQAAVDGAAHAAVAPKTEKPNANPSPSSNPTPGAQPEAAPQVAAPAPPKRRKPDGDIQKCLALEDNRAIAKCTEQYR